MALEERIGNVSTGLSEETVLKHLKQRKHSAEKGPQIDAEPCCVCQVNLTKPTYLNPLHACAHCLIT